jgi:hypothetical protein
MLWQHLSKIVQEHKPKQPQNFIPWFSTDLFPDDADYHPLAFPALGDRGFLPSNLLAMIKQLKPINYKELFRRLSKNFHHYIAAKWRLKHITLFHNLSLEEALAIPQIHSSLYIK